MATISKKAAQTVENSTKVVNKVNKEIVKASLLAIDTTVKNGEKWQQLASKLIKKSEKVRNEQVNMAFDTAEAVKGQFVTGTKRMKDLVGFDSQVEKVQKMVVNNPVSKKVMEVTDDVTKMISKNPMVKKAEKTSAEMKTKGMAMFNDAKKDVTAQATKLKNLGEAKLKELKKDAENYANGTKATPAKKTVAKKAVAKKPVAKKAVAKVATTAKKVVAKKPVAKKAVVKAPVAKAPVAKVEVKATEVKTPVAKVEVKATEVKA